MSSVATDSINCEVNGNELVLNGAINEDFDIDAIMGLVGQDLIVNFKDVSMINSCGVREWIKLIDGIGAKGFNLTYSHCPAHIVSQMNMVKGFIGTNITVDSIYAPYFCEECDAEELVLIKVSDIKDTAAPERKCAECGADEMEFDAIEDTYFKFLSL